jgi:hypothetical protein
LEVTVGNDTAVWALDVPRRLDPTLALEEGIGEQHDNCCDQGCIEGAGREGGWVGDVDQETAKEKRWGKIT